MFFKLHVLLNFMFASSWGFVVTAFLQQSWIINHSKWVDQYKLLYKVIFHILRLKFFFSLETQTLVCEFVSKLIELLEICQSCCLLMMKKNEWPYLIVSYHEPSYWQYLCKICISDEKSINITSKAIIQFYFESQFLQVKVQCLTYLTLKSLQ